MTGFPPSGFSQSHFNPPSRLPVSGPLALVLHDVTLREGEQAPPVAFSLEDRVAIAQALDGLGVPRIQVGFAGRDDDAVAAIKRAGVRADLSELCVTFDDHWRRAVDAAAGAGVDVLLLLFRSSDEQLSMMNFTREQGRTRVAEAVQYARNRVRCVVFQPSFATTADPTYLTDLCRVAAEAGADEVALADTVGVLNPHGTARLVSAVRALVATPIGVHLHDDYGLAVANSLAAIEAGASVIEVSVLGLGERAGNCPLEELAVVLEGLYRVPTGLRLEHLTEVARVVADRAGVSIPPAKAIVGEDVFAQKLDLHVRVTSSAPWLHEPFDPAKVGQQRRLKLGRGSGPYAIRAKLAALGLEINESHLPALVEFVNHLAIGQKGVVSDEQLSSAVKSLQPPS